LRTPLFLQKNTAGKFGAKMPKKAKPQQKNEHQKTAENSAISPDAHPCSPFSQMGG
jgi:hypothetical protein